MRIITAAALLFCASLAQAAGPRTAPMRNSFLARVFGQHASEVRQAVKQAKKARDEKLITAFASQHATTLTLDDAVYLAKKTDTHDANNEVLRDFAKQNSRALQVKQAIKLANKTTMKDDNDKLLLDYAKDNASTLTVGDAFKLAKKTLYWGSHADLLSGFQQANPGRVSPREAKRLDKQIAKAKGPHASYESSTSSGPSFGVRTTMDYQGHLHQTYGDQRVGGISYEIGTNRPEMNMGGNLITSFPGFGN
jgi:hypothetical protein